MDFEYEEKKIEALFEKRQGINIQQGASYGRR